MSNASPKKRARPPSNDQLNFKSLPAKRARLDASASADKENSANSSNVPSGAPSKSLKGAQGAAGAIPDPLNVFEPLVLPRPFNFEENATRILRTKFKLQEFRQDQLPPMEALYKGKVRIPHLFRLLLLFSTLFVPLLP